MKKISFKEHFTKARLRIFAVDTIYDVIGSILYAVGYYTFASNADFAPGGVGGIAIIINHYLPWMPLFLCQNIINIPIAIICFRLLGKKFFIKSVKTMLFMWIFGDFIVPLFPRYGGAEIAEASRLLSAIFAGILTGAGLALVYMRGSSTGGSDFVIMSIRKKKPHLSVGSITLVIDGIIIVAGGVVFKNVNAVLYGMIMTMLSSLVIDKIMYGSGSQKMLLIISDKTDEIKDRIFEVTERGVTFLKAVGAYTGQDRHIIMCVCSKTEVFPTREIVKKTDPNAMVMLSTIDEAYGLGFNPLNEQ
ncbi:MAG: YitT family protein [Clostridiales bacterium]|nr:YitT family protein [Clostridiales bacterium]